MNNRSILIIDDEQATLDMLSMLLEAYGYSVLTASNGETGVQTYDKNRPDIVLTDIKMPGMDGIQVLQKIKEIDTNSEVVVITGHGDMDLAIQALNLNATDFVNKPVQRDALNAALKRAEERLSASRNKDADIHVSQRKDVTLLDVKGNVSSRSEPYLVEAFNTAIAEGRPAIVLCFEEKTAINGAGISVLTQLLMEGTRKGYIFGLAGLSDNFQAVADAVGLTRFAKIYPSVEAAVRELGAV